MALVEKIHSGEKPLASVNPVGPTETTLFGDFPFGLLRWVRPVAAFAWMVTILGRALAPSLHGAGVGSDKWVYRLDIVAGLGAQGLLLTLLALLFALAFGVLYAPRLSLIFRLTFTSLAGLVFGLAAPAGSGPLTSRSSGLLAASVIALALLAAGQALARPITRVVGVLLAGMSLAALTRQGAWLVAIFASNPGRVAPFASARTVATVALAVQAITTVGAFFWLASRRRRRGISWHSLLLTFAAMMAWSAEQAFRSGAAARPWQIVLANGLAHLASSPVPLISPTVRFFFVALTPLLALFALLIRGQIPVLVGSLALILLGGVDADAPLCALGTTVAALALVLASQDNLLPSLSPGATPKKLGNVVGT